MGNDKVVELKSAKQEAADPRLTMTPAEIEAFMRQEEAEIDAHLNKFIGSIPMPDTSSISEEDEEEEIVTLDFEKGMATEKVAEGVLARDSQGNVTEVNDPVVVEIIKKTAMSVEEEPTLKGKYQDMITDRFVSKAISSLIEKLNKTSNTIFDEATKSLPTAIGDHLAWEASEIITKQKRELQLAISGGQVRYDRIPEWAKSYVDEYIQSGLGALIDFVERD